MNASTVTGYPSIFLCQRTRPKDFSISVETKEESLNTVCIDIPSFGIASKACPSNSVEGYRGMEDVELIIPEQFAGFGIKAGDAFLFGDIFADASDDVDPTVEKRWVWSVL